MSLVEMLIALAILATLMGVVTPLIQNEIRAARSARTAKEMSQIQKSLAQAANREGHQASFIPDTPYCYPRSQRPEFMVSVDSLVPRFLSEVPKDSWGNEIYRYGNYIVSNGENGSPGDEDDVYIKVTEFPEERDPDTGQVFMPRDVNEAWYQVGFLAMQVKLYITKNGVPPPSIWEVYESGMRGSPLDPWNSPYVLVNESSLKVVASRGPDGIQGTEDDITVSWDESDKYEDSFKLGFRGWVKIFPTTDSPQTTPIEWVQDADETKNRMRFKGDGVNGLHTSAWVRPYPPGTDVTQFAKVQVSFNAVRTGGSIYLGLILNYRGPGTGVRGTVEIPPAGESALLKIDNATPKLITSLNGGPPAQGYASPAEVAGDSWGDVNLSLETLPTSPPSVRLLISGGEFSGSLVADLNNLSKEIGACGFFVRAPTPDSKFVVDFDNFGVYKN